MAFHELLARRVIRKLRNEHFRETVVEVVRLLLLAEHYSVGWGREEDLLDEHIGGIWQKCDEWQYKKHDPGLARVENQEVLACDFRLEKVSNWSRVASNHADQIEEQTCDVYETCKPVPVHCFNEKLADYDIHDKCESNSTCKPMRLGQSC